MNRPYTWDPSLPIDELDGIDAGLPRGGRGPNVDSNAVRWVLAATVVFWLLVYVVGRSYF